VSAVYKIVLPKMLISLSLWGTVDEELSDSAYEPCCFVMTSLLGELDEIECARASKYIDISVLCDGGVILRIW